MEQIERIKSIDVINALRPEIRQEYADFIFGTKPVHNLDHLSGEVHRWTQALVLLEDALSEKGQRDVDLATAYYLAKMREDHPETFFLES